MDHLARHIESLIFVAEQPLSVAEISACLEEAHQSQIDIDSITDAIDSLQRRYDGEDYAMELLQISEGYQFLTKPVYHHTVGTYLKQLNKKKLSKSALETLSIVAYRQPVIKSDIEAIRGVNCDYSIQKLLDKELVEITGRSDGPGRPLLYATSDKFMDYFGLSSMNDLPRLKDLAVPDDSIGESSEDTSTEEE